MTCFIVDYAIRFGESELLVDVEKSRDTLSVAADGVVTTTHEDDAHVTSYVFDPRRGACVLDEPDNVAVVCGSAYKARIGIVDI